MINGKQNRFNPLLNSLEEGNPKTLSMRLREMENLGLIKRKVYSHETPIRIEYYPTEKTISQHVTKVGIVTILYRDT
jgi:DNA-binding HxlR family transcriptional regulator